MHFRTSDRIYAHIDCNAFYASCEVLRNPALRGKKVAVWGDIIVAANYKAKKSGIRTGMRSWEVKRLAPDAIIVRQDLAFYGKISAQLFSYLQSLFSTVTPFSIDEAFVDVTDIADDEASYTAFAKKLKLDILREIGIPVSVGIGSTHIRAKIFGDQRKPLGETIALTSETVRDIFLCLPVTEVPFIGRATGEKLRYIARTIEDFRTLPFRRVHELLGKNGTDLWLELNGVDIMRFSHPDIPKSISRTRSFNHAMTSEKDVLWSHILANLERAMKDLMIQSLSAGSVTLYLRDRELRTYVFSHRFDERTTSRQLILATLRDLFAKAHDSTLTYRSTGVILGDFQEVKPEQLSLDQVANMTSEKDRNLAGAIEKINGRFWKNLVTLGILEKISTRTTKKFLLPMFTTK